ncbi:MAG: hypothetical protein ACI37N_11325 [Prevotella sp.]
MLNYIPTVWTSLGILGTFVTIVYVLGDGTMVWSDINEMVKRISPAFETSIIGIIGAILTSIIAKMIYAKEDKDDVANYQKTFPYSPEQYIGYLHREATSLNKKMDAVTSYNNKILKQLADILVSSQKHHDALIEESRAQRSLAERMINDFTENLKDFYSTMYEEEKLHMQELTEQYLNGINQIITSTHGTIKSKFETLFTEHSNALKSLMEDESKQYAQLSKDIKEQICNDSQKIVESINETNKSQKDAIDTLIADNTSSLSKLSKDIQDGIADVSKGQVQLMQNITSDVCHSVEELVSEFKVLISGLKENFETIASNLPEDIRKAKEELLNTFTALTEKQYEELSNENKIFVNSLLKKVEEYNKDITMKANDSQAEWLNAVNAELQRLLGRVDDDVKTNSNILKDTTKEINDKLVTIVGTLGTSTKDYNQLIGQLNTLIAALQKETNATEAYANSISSTNTQLSAIQKLISDVINKNLQLRQELSQWKRIHKQVKVDVDKGVKECPNCHAENPIDANYCRKCTTSFWECTPNK